MEKRTAVFSKADEIENLVKEHYGFSYSIAKEEELFSDYWTIVITSTEVEAIWLHAENWVYAKLHNGNGSSIDLVIAHLVSDGHISPGTYVISNYLV